MRTTHTRISNQALAGVDYLCGLTGDNRRHTFDRIVAFAIKEVRCYRDAKKYQEVLESFGEPVKKHNVTAIA